MPMHFSPNEIKQLRAETIGTQYVTHFNNAGAALIPNPVSQVVQDYLAEEAKYGGYEMAAKYQSDLEQTYTTIAQFIGAKTNEIALVENATEAWHKAFHAIPFEKGDIILTSEAEYATNYISYLQKQEQIGIEIKVIPSDEQGQINVEALEKMISPTVKLISVTHIPTNGGLINPAEAVGEIAKANGILYLLDACQSIGQIPINVEKIGCDMLSATGRKYLRGPRGTGFLYVRQAVYEQLTPPFLDLHSASWESATSFDIRNDARRFENWESNKGLILGLKKSVEYADAIGMERIQHRIQYLGNLLRDSLQQVKGVQVHDIGQQKGGLVSLSKKGYTREQILTHLSKHQINCSPIFYNGTLLDMQKRNLAHNLVRASVHYYNTEAEIQHCCTILDQL